MESKYWKSNRIDLVEEYSVDGTKRYRFHIRETNVIIDIKAIDKESAWNKIFEMLERIQFRKQEQFE